MDKDLRRIYDAQLFTIPAGEGVTVDARGAARLHVIPGDGATATVSRVDSPGAAAHEAGDGRAVTEFPHERDWHFYHITSAGGESKAAVT
jgi:hypothetical protein